jgi:hypothetical protein
MNGEHRFGFWWNQQFDDAPLARGGPHGDDGQESETNVSRNALTHGGGKRLAIARIFDQTLVQMGTRHA